MGKGVRQKQNKGLLKRKWPDAWIKKLTVIIAFVALIISLASLILSIQNTISEDKMARYSRELAKPTVAVEAAWNSSLEVEKLCITNRGERCKGLKVTVYPYYYVVVKDNNGYSEGYISIYEAEEESLSPVLVNPEIGEMYNLSYDNADYDRLTGYISNYKNFLEQKGGDNEKKLYYLSLEYFIKIEYEDVLGNLDTRIYRYVTGVQKQYYNGLINYTRKCNIEVLTNEASYFPAYEAISKLMDDLRLKIKNADMEHAVKISDSYCFANVASYLNGFTTTKQYEYLESVVFKAYDANYLFYQPNGILE